MRNPFGIAARCFRGWILPRSAGGLEPEITSRALDEAVREASHQTAARLSALEERLEECTARIERSITAIEASATQVKETCSGLAGTLGHRLEDMEDSVESLREAHEKRVRHVEERHRLEVERLEREHATALRAHLEAREGLAGRLRGLADGMASDICAAITEPGDEPGPRRRFWSLPLEGLARVVQWRYARRLEETIEALASRVSELRRELRAEGRREYEAPVVVSVPARLALNANGHGNGNSNGNGNGNGTLGLPGKDHGIHELETALSGAGRS